MNIDSYCKVSPYLERFHDDPRIDYADEADCCPAYTPKLDEQFPQCGNCYHFQWVTDLVRQN